LRDARRGVASGGAPPATRHARARRSGRPGADLAPRAHRVAMQAAIDRDPSALARNVARHDYLRGSPWARGGPGRDKEWLHLCVLTPEIDFLANFSVSDDTSEVVARGTSLCRLTVLCFDGTWEGDVETFEFGEAMAREGDVDFRFGRNACRFHDGAYHLQI